MRVGSLVVVCCILVAGAQSARGEASDEAVIEVFNPGFERVEAGGWVSGWRAEESDAELVQVLADTEVVHGGVGSLRVGCASPTSVTITSEPVRLRVGHLYRLSGWIRTEGLISDPTSRYPTAVPSCLSMTSFPFTNHSPAVGATSPWTLVWTSSRRCSSPPR